MPLRFEIINGVGTIDIVWFWIIMLMTVITASSSNGDVLHVYSWYLEPSWWYLELIFLPFTGVDQQVSICDPLAGCHKHVSSLGFTLEVSGQLLYVHMPLLDQV